MKKFIMALLVAGLLIGLGVMLGKGQLTKKEDMHMMEMGVITLNLAEPRHYVKMGLAYSYEGEKNGERLEKKSDALKDIVIVNLISESQESFLDVEKVEEKKEFIKDKMNRALGEEMIGEIFLTELRVGK